jgi:hypothetical protein
VGGGNVASKAVKLASGDLSECIDFIVPIKLIGFIQTAATFFFHSTLAGNQTIKKNCPLYSEKSKHLTIQKTRR